MGAVALDRCGHIAAATSTGGYDAKVPGRVGDSPIVGAGVYADDAVGGFSATGHGEHFIRFSIAKDVADRMRYAARNAGTRRCATTSASSSIPATGGDGGLIGFDRNGNVAMIWNAAGMYRGYATGRRSPGGGRLEGPEHSKPRPDADRG